MCSCPLCAVGGTKTRVRKSAGQTLWVNGHFCLHLGSSPPKDIKSCCKSNKTVVFYYLQGGNDIAFQQTTKR